MLSKTEFKQKFEQDCITEASHTENVKNIINDVKKKIKIMHYLNIMRNSTMLN